MGQACALFPSYSDPVLRLLQDYLRKDPFEQSNPFVGEYTGLRFTTHWSNRYVTRRNTTGRVDVVAHRRWCYLS